VIFLKEYDILNKNSNFSTQLMLASKANKFNQIEQKLNLISSTKVTNAKDEAYEQLFQRVNTIEKNMNDELKNSENKCTFLDIKYVNSKIKLKSLTGLIKKPKHDDSFRKIIERMKWRNCRKK
jgi:phosphoglycerate-specific signal transduction histidine kinase